MPDFCDVYEYFNCLPQLMLELNLEIEPEYYSPLLQEFLYFRFKLHESAGYIPENAEYDHDIAKVLSLKLPLEIIEMVFKNGALIPAWELSLMLNNLSRIHVDGADKCECWLRYDNEIEIQYERIRCAPCNYDNENLQITNCKKFLRFFFEDMCSTCIRSPLGDRPNPFFIWFYMMNRHGIWIPMREAFDNELFDETDLSDIKHKILDEFGFPTHLR